MAMKQNKLTYEEIDSKIENFKIAEEGKPKDLVALVNIFCKLQDIRSIKSDEVGPLLDDCCLKMGEFYWKFLLEVFSRLFYKSDPLHDSKKNKPVKAILFSLLKTIENKFGDAFDKNLLNKAITENDPVQIKAFAVKLEDAVSFEKEEFLALLYMLLMLYGNKLLLQNRECGLIDIEKCFLELYHLSDRKDKLCIKAVVSALKGPDACVEFYHFVRLYEGAALKISRFEEKTAAQESAIEAQKEEIETQKAKIIGLQDEIRGLSEDLRDKQRLISALENDLKAGKEQNEFNENLYQKQYETLKREFIKDLKKKLSLELQGLEDLADGLSEDKKVKIQRRLDNIYKILLKEEK